ncbi:MAG: hypothetical protein JW870_16910 [Candidatus Delongbacteria bacterium]|nr:hypothetical protein [Candidatus Delongbacteria bacterium]
MRKIALIIPIIIFGILAIFNLGGSKNGCYSLLNGILGFFSVFMAIAYTVILSIFSFYWRIKKKEQFNFLPILTLAITFTIYLLIQYINRERPVIIKANTSYENPDFSRKMISLTLYKNNKFTLRRSGHEYGCMESGRYLLARDTLVLIRSKQYVQGFDYTHFIINRENKIMIILNENHKVDSSLYLNIE